MQFDEKTGFLWLATEAGMTRFNGMGFTNFTKENTPALSHERMYLLVKSNSGKIYGADVGRHVFYVEHNLVKGFHFPGQDNIQLLKLGFFLRLEDSLMRKKLYSIFNQSRELAWLNVLQFPTGH